MLRYSRSEATVEGYQGIKQGTDMKTPEGNSSGAVTEVPGLSIGRDRHETRGE